MEARKKNVLILSAVNFFKGIVFGMVNVVPGISGGTIAVVMGIYEGMISSLNTAFKSKKQFAAAVLYLLPIALGAVIGLLGVATLVSYCLEKFSLPTNVFFVGLIIGSIPTLIFIIYPGLKKERRKNRNGAAGESLKDTAESKGAGFKVWHIIPFIAAAALVTGLAFVTPAETELASFVWWQYALLPVAGFGSAVVMMIPGVSGAFFLKLIGWYSIIVGAISVTNFNLLIIGLTGIGIVLGVLAAARIIDFLFKRAKTITYLAILGLVTGCIASVFIWPDTYKTGTGTWGIVIGAALGIAGAACALLLGYSSKSNGQSAGANGQETPGQDPAAEKESKDEAREDTL